MFPVWPVKRVAYKSGRYGRQPYMRKEVVEIVDFCGVGLDAKHLIKLLKGLRATKLKQVDVEAIPAALN